MIGASFHAQSASDYVDCGIAVDFCENGFDMPRDDDACQREREEKRCSKRPLMMVET